MKDRFQREIDYMRISVTENCNLWCHYCRPKSGSCTGSEILSYAEILRLCRIFIRLYAVVYALGKVGLVKEHRHSVYNLFAEAFGKTQKF